MIETKSQTKLYIRKKSLIHNFQEIQKQTDADVWPVVKAFGYGLCAMRVARCLLSEVEPNGFFVATLDEAITLSNFISQFKAEVKKDNLNVKIVVFSSLDPADMAQALHLGIVPCLNSIAEIETYLSINLENKPLPFIHIDTGMSRLGLDKTEAAYLVQKPEVFEATNCDYLMSHLACAEDSLSDYNKLQKQRFDTFWQTLFPKIKIKPKLSLSASAGTYLGPDYHYDLIRTGIAIYGGRVSIDQNIAPVIELQAKVLQIREIEVGDKVGYGVNFTAKRKTKIATLGIGYSDGFLRNYNNSAEIKVSFYHSDIKKTDRFPIVATTSMDYITIDITDSASFESLKVGSYVNVIDRNYDINDIAKDAMTIPYEILTNLTLSQERIKRIIIDD